MDEASERRRRAQERQRRALLHKTRLQPVERDLSPVQGEEAISLATRLTLESWATAGHPMPSYAREDTPVRFIPRRPP
jgi:hypothetical protein